MLGSYEHPCDNSSEPDHYEADDDADRDIEQSHSDLTILERAKGLILEGRERGVGADEADRKQIAPVGACGGADQKRHEQSDQEAAAHVDDEGPVGKPNTVPGSEVDADNVAGNCAEKASQTHREIFQHTPQSSLIRIVAGGTCREDDSATRFPSGVIICPCMDRTAVWIG